MRTRSNARPRRVTTPPVRFNPPRQRPASRWNPATHFIKKSAAVGKVRPAAAAAAPAPKLESDKGSQESMLIHWQTMSRNALNARTWGGINE